MTETLNIYTLGNFQVVNGEEHVTKEQRTSSKRWKLFQYLLTFNEREISREELIQVLKLHKNEDPEGALSALVYRLRTLLSKTCNISKDYLIKTTGSAYKFNNKADYWHDAEIFENTCKKIEKLNNRNSEKTIDLFEKALDHYNGDYLNEARSEEWLWSARNHYRDLLKKSLFKIDDLLREKGEFEKVFSFYDEVQNLVQFDEDIIAGLLENLLEAEKYSQAQYKYKEIKEMYEENDLILPPVIESTYMSGMKKKNNGNPELFLDKLSEKCDTDGAFVCSPDKFMEIYELEKRRMERDVPNRCVIHLRLTKQNIEKKKNEQVVDRIEKIGEQLLESLVDQLRRGDIVCRWNKKHFVVLVADTDCEEAKKIVNRLKNSFKARYGLPANISIKNKIYELC